MAILPLLRNRWFYGFLLLIVCIISCENGDSHARAVQFLTSGIEVESNTEKLKYFSDAIAADSGLALAFYHRALVFQDLGEKASSRKDFNRAIALDPQMGEAWLWRANFFYIEQHYKNALKDINKAIELGSTTGFTLFLRGSINLALEQYQEAVTDYSQAQKLGMDGPELYFNRAIALEEMDRKEDAINDYYRYLETAPVQDVLKDSVKIWIINLGGKVFE